MGRCTAAAIIGLLAVSAVTSLQDGVARQTLNGNDLIGLLSSLANQAGGGGGGGGGIAANLLQQLQQSSGAEGGGASSALGSLAQYLGGLGQQAGPGQQYFGGQGQGHYADQGGGGFGLYGGQRPLPGGQYPGGPGQYAGGQPYPYQRPLQRPPRPVRPGGPLGGYGQYPPGAGGLGPYPGAYPGQYPAGPGLFPGGFRPNPNGAASFTDALSSIAQYDDLRCVPRLLCEVASGGRPTYGKQDSLVPFLSKDTLQTLLTVMNFADTSPLFAFGRAALLGITSRGDTKGCFAAYPTCPRDPDTLVNYLNNHNGGFFRFFNQHQHNKHQQLQQQQQYGQAQYAPHYATQYGQKQQKYGLQKYTPQQQKYTAQQQQYSPQQQQYNYQQQYPYGQQRIQNTKHSLGVASNQFETTEIPYRQQGTRERDQFNFPPYNGKYYTTTPSYNPLSSVTDYSTHSDRDKGPTLRFPRDNEAVAVAAASPSQVIFGEDSSQNYYKKTRGSKSISFPEFGNSFGNEEKPGAVPMVFPDRTGTGDLRLDTDEYGNTIIFSVSDTGLKVGRFKTPEELLFGKGITNLKFPNEFDGTRKQRYTKFTKAQTLKFPQYRSLDQGFLTDDEK